MILECVAVAVIVALAYSREGLSFALSVGLLTFGGAYLAVMVRAALAAP